MRVPSSLIIFVHVNDSRESYNIPHTKVRETAPNNDDVRMLDDTTRVLRIIVGPPHTAILCQRVTSVAAHRKHHLIIPEYTPLPIQGPFTIFLVKYHLALLVRRGFSRDFKLQKPKSSCTRRCTVLTDTFPSNPDLLSLISFDVK